MNDTPYNELITLFKKGPYHNSNFKLMRVEHTNYDFKNTVILEIKTLSDTYTIERKESTLSGDNSVPSLWITKFKMLSMGLVSNVHKAEEVAELVALCEETYGINLPEWWEIYAKLNQKEQDHRIYESMKDILKEHNLKDVLIISKQAEPLFDLYAGGNVVNRGEKWDDFVILDYPEYKLR